MPIIRSYTNAFEVVDYTKELAVVPNKWTLLNEVGLFQPEYLSTHTVTFEQQDHALALIGDQVRGSKPQANQDELRKIFSYAIPHFRLLMLCFHKTFKVSVLMVQLLLLKQLMQFWLVKSSVCRTTSMC